MHDLIKAVPASSQWFSSQYKQTSTKTKNKCNVWAEKLSCSSRFCTAQDPRRSCVTGPTAVPELRQGHVRPTAELLLSGWGSHDLHIPALGRFPLVKRAQDDHVLVVLLTAWGGKGNASQAFGTVKHLEMINNTFDKGGGEIFKIK